MIGTIVNTVCILTGSLAGSLIKRNIKPEIQKVMFTAMGLASLGLGCNAFIQHFSQSEFPVLFIVSMALGGLAGTAIDIDKRFKNLVDRNSTDDKADGGLSKGLSTCILLFCIGTFSIVGPMNSALYSDNTFLFTNSTLDLITSTVFATTYGIGIAFAAPVLFCWQGMFYLIAKIAGGIIPEGMMHELIAVGGLLILASGLNLLEIKDCKSLNLLPALIVPVIFYAALMLFQ